MHAALKKIFIATVLAFFAVVLVNFLVNNVYTHRLIRAAVEREIAKHSDLKVEFEALSISLVPLQITVFGIKVAAPSRYRLSSVVQLAQLQLRFAWWDLFIGRARIAKIRVQDLDLYWSSEWDLAEFFKDSPDQQGFWTYTEDGRVRWPPKGDLPLGALELQNARIYASFPSSEPQLFVPPGSLPAPAFSLALAGLDAKVIFDGWKQIDAEITAGSTRAFAGEKPLFEEARVAAELTFQERELSGRYLSIQSREASLSGSATAQLDLDAFTKGLLGIKVTSHLQGQANLSLLGSFLDIPDTLGGLDGSLDFKADFPIGNSQPSPFAISGKAKASDARIGGIRLFDTETGFTINSEEIIFSDTLIIKEGNRLGKAQGRIGFGQDLPFDFNLHAQELPLNAILTAFEVDFDAFDFMLTGKDVSISGRGFPLGIEISGQSQIAEITTPGLVYERKLFPRSPHCELGLDVNITNEFLAFADNRGRCYSPESRAAEHKAAESPLVLDGKIFFASDKGIDLQVVSPSLQLALLDYFLQVPLSGHVQTKTTIRGAYAQVGIESQIKGRDVKVQGIPLGKVSGLLRFKGQDLAWQQLQALPAEGGRILSNKGNINIQSLHMALHHFAVEELSSGFIRSFIKGFWPSLPLSFGLKAGELRWDGPLLLPAAGTGTMDFKLGALKYAGEALSDSVQGRLSSKQKIWKFEQLIARLGDLHLAALLTLERKHDDLLKNPAAADFFWAPLGFSPDDSLAVQVQVRTKGKKDPASLQLLPFFRSELQRIQLKALLAIKGEFKGTLQSLQGTVQGSCQNMSLLGASIAPLQWQSFLAGSKLATTFAQAGDALEGRLSLDLVQQGLPFEWYLSMRRFDIRSLGTPYFYQDPRNFAYVSGSWSLKGNMANWWKARGEIALSDLQVQYADDAGSRAQYVRLHNAHPVQIYLRDDGWRYGDRALVLEGDYLHAELDLNKSRPPEQLSLVWKGHVKASLLALLAKQVESARGKIGFEASLTGPVQDLSFSTHIFNIEKKLAKNPVGNSEKKAKTQPQEGKETKANKEPEDSAGSEALSLGLADLRPEFQDILLDLTYQAGIIRVHKLQAKKGAGSVEAVGEVNVGATALISRPLHINFDQLRVIYPVPYLKSFDTLLSGELQLSGQGKPYLLAGDVRIDKARSTSKVDLRSEVVNVMRQESLVTQASAVQGEAPYMQLNLNFLADKSIVIHNKNMQMTVSSELQLQGDERKQILLGNVNIVKGKFYFKREFDITHGEITFDDPIRINPKLNIMGTTDISPYKVTIAVSGPTASPIVEVLVDPATREDGSPISSLEALVLVSRGSLPKEERKSAETQGVGISEILNNVFWSQGQVPFEKISEKFLSDAIQVYPDVTTDYKGSPVLQFNGIVKVTDNIEAIAKKTANKSELSVEVPVHKNISLSGSMVQNQDEEAVENEGKDNTSVDLRFRFSIQ